ncbi:MAG: primosomal protein N' [Candidatus Sumerlaeaceae bacterium]|nr:primosomal protein N' [Candidatus Sumerlaeaceae bacterium]
MARKRPEPDLFSGLLPQEEPSQPARETKPRRVVAYPNYASVAVAAPVDQTYTYGVPAALAGSVAAGSLVEVPFAGRRMRGFVVSLTDAPPKGLDHLRIRALTAVISPGYRVSPELLALAQWLAEETMCSLGEALACVSFIGLQDVGEKQQAAVRLAEPEPSPMPKLTAKQKSVADFLRSRSNEPLPPAEITRETGAGPSVIRKLLANGILEPVRRPQARRDDYEREVEPDTAPPLNPDQQAAYEAAVAALKAGRHETFLLHGITSSGKTEVYLRLIGTALEGGGSAIMLVPEISLTPQTVDRFRRRFGDMVGVYHSRLTAGQKFDLYGRIARGECRVIVGARSALFAPLPRLRVVVVDEEHEATYKQDSAPRYHARTVAVEVGRRANAIVVLGSATPSIESYHAARAGRMTLLNLRKRVDARPLPEVTVVDMAVEARDAQNSGLLSHALHEAMTAALARRETVLLFLNRRGFFNFLVCLNCHHVLRCDHCDVSLTLHKPRNRLICHYCNRSLIPPKVCPECEEAQLSPVGLGTQRLEEHVAQEFPGARVLRLDLDTMRHRTAFIAAWRAIERGEADILLGTQMIAKGLHIEHVTVVGVPLADVSLFQPDFRAAERAFSLLTQVAGRAGRGERPGRVIVQTYVPQHYAIRFAREHDYVGFFEKEERVRRVLRFPPFYQLISVLAAGSDAGRTADLMKEFARILRDAAYRDGNAASVLGPAPAPLARLNDQHRWRLLLRGREPVRMRRLIREALDRFDQVKGKSAIQLTVDVDPQDLL